MKNSTITLFCLLAVGCSNRGCNAEMVYEPVPGVEYPADTGTDEDGGPPYDSGPGEFWVPDSGTDSGFPVDSMDAGGLDSGLFADSGSPNDLDSGLMGDAGEPGSTDAGSNSDACVDRHGEHGSGRGRGHEIGVGHGCSEPGRPEWAPGPPWDRDAGKSRRTPPGHNRR